MGTDPLVGLSDDASPDEAFRFLLSKVVQPILKQSNFKKAGSTFHCWPSSDACKVVNFQRSSGSTSSRIRFTVNLGVYLPCLSSRTGSVGTAERRDPKEYDCQYRARIGLLMAAKNDHWWDLDGKTGVGSIRQELLVALADGLGQLDDLASPRKFLDALHAGGCGLTSVMHKRYVDRLTAVLDGSGQGAVESGAATDSGSISMGELAAIDVLRLSLEQNERSDPESLRKDPRYSKIIELAERFGLDWKPVPRCGQ